MNASLIGTLVGLELTQRIRSVAWYVLLGVFGVLLLIVTVLSFAVFSSTPDTGIGVFSVVVYFVLLLVVLVSPTLSGNAINGDRDAATLAPVQVTLATTGDILIAKFLAAWVTGLAFLVVAVPFLLVAMVSGGVAANTLFISLVILIVEVGVVAGIGVGLSGILARPLFSVAVTYLVVAALVLGTVIAFGLGGSAVRSEAVSYNRTLAYDSDGSPERSTDGTTYLCGEWESYTYEVPRFDWVWWTLAANPFVILADATPTALGSSGYPVDLFGQVKFAVRAAQQEPQLETRWDECDDTSGYMAEQGPTPEQILASSTPSWFVGLLLQTLLTVGLLWWAWARTRTPARRLPPGTRIA